MTYETVVAIDLVVFENIIIYSNYSSNGYNVALSPNSLRSVERYLLSFAN